MEKNFIDKLAYILIKDNKILVTLSKGKDTWYIPGGKRESGETDHQALIREVNEELTVNVIEDSIIKYGVFEAQAHGKPDGTIVRMTCYEADFTGDLTPAAEIAEIDFFTYSQIDMVSPVDVLIFEDLKNKGLIK
ncbi:MAG: NUDIX domain-containing protein [Candidatus Pacebacteria bacterium]|nr:NUDIX domain-containing protein [Candidatus Paceibacterota bacterium]